jgi:hypothetical protein
MTKEDLDKMTPEEKRIAISEMCGYKVHSWGITYPDGRESGRGYVNVSDLVPDYLNSRDSITSACSEVITDKVKQAEFAENLIQIINRKLDGQHRFLGATPFHVATTEAVDLADAFLLTVG